MIRGIRKYIVISAAVALLAGSGCATSRDIERVEHIASTTKAEVSSLSNNVEDARAEIADDARLDRQTLEKVDRLSADVASLREDVSAVMRNQANLGNAINTLAGGELMKSTGQMEELRYELEQTKLKLDAFKASLLQKLADVEAAIDSLGVSGASERPDELDSRSIKPGTFTGDTAGASGSPAASNTVPPVGDPLQLYQAAYLEYTKGDYELALMGFKDYLTSFPDGEFAGNAQYWVGESLYSLGHYSEALIEFEKVLDDYPKSPKAPGAMLKKGFCFDALDRPDDARSVYTELGDRYPGTDAAKIAAERMTKKPRGQVPGR